MFELMVPSRWRLGVAVLGLAACGPGTLPVGAGSDGSTGSPTTGGSSPSTGPSADATSSTTGSSGPATTVAGSTGTGTGGPQAPACIEIDPQPGDPCHVAMAMPIDGTARALADRDGDGLRDLVITRSLDGLNGTYAVVETHPGLSDATFADVPTEMRMVSDLDSADRVLPMSPGPGGVGERLLLAGPKDVGFLIVDVTVVLNDSGPQPVTTGDGPSPDELAVGDFDGDGDDDIAWSPGNGVVTVRWTAATPTTVDYQAPPMALPVGTDLAVGDQDQDGADDLLALSDQTVDNTFQLVVTWLHLDLNAETVGVATPSALGVPGTLELTRVLDLDGDLVPDLATAPNLSPSDPPASGALTVRRSDTSNGFLPPTTTMLDAPVGSYDFGDVDGDGRLDLVLTPFAVAEVWWAPGDGVGSFGTLRRLALPEVPGILIDVSDRNGDGLSDMVLAGDLVAWLLVTVPQ